MPLYFYISPALKIETQGLRDAETMDVIFHVKKKKVRGVLFFYFSPPTGKSQSNDKNLRIRCGIVGVACAPIDLPEMAELISIIQLQYNGIIQVIGSAYLDGFFEGTF